MALLSGVRRLSIMFICSCRIIWVQMFNKSCVHQQDTVNTYYDWSSKDCSALSQFTVLQTVQHHRYYVARPVRLSVRLTVRPSIPYRLVTRTQRNAEKSKCTQTFPSPEVSEVPIFSSKGQRLRWQAVKNRAKSLLTGSESSAADADCTIGLRHC